MGIEVYDSYGWGYNRAICPTDKIDVAGNRQKIFSSSYTFIDSSNNSWYNRVCDVAFPNNEFLSGTLTTRVIVITSAGSVQNASENRIHLSKIIGINRKSNS